MKISEIGGLNKVDFGILFEWSGLANSWSYVRPRLMGRAGTMYLILVGLMVCLAGGVFTALMWRSFDRASGQRNWVEVSCQILESQIKERQIGPDVPLDYGFGVLYGYDYEGQSYTSTQHSIRGVAWARSREKSEKLAERFPAGSAQVCYVNPEAPKEAVLKLDSKAPGYSLWFPLLILTGGLGIVFGAVRKGFLTKASDLPKA